MHEKTKTSMLSAGDCRQAMLMVQYLINLLKDGSNVHCNHLVGWVYGACHVCDPCNFPGCIIADIAGQLLQERKKHSLAQRNRLQQQYPMKINLKNVVGSKKSWQSITSSDNNHLNIIKSYLRT